jgi:CBS domain-containing protein
MSLIETRRDPTPMSTASALSPAAILAAIEDLRRHAPFDRMEREHLEWMVERLQLGYYGRGEIILSPEQGEAAKFYVIKQGIVQGEQNVAQASDADTWLELTAGECFPLGALLSKRGVASRYRAKEDTFCYELPAGDFHELLRLSPPFQDFCTRRIASLLEQSKQIIQAQYAHSSAEQQSMSSPLSAIVRRQPVTCRPDTPIREALETMHRLGIGSIVVVENLPPEPPFAKGGGLEEEGGKPVGIFTLHDVLDRVTLAGKSLDQPIADVMTTGLTTLPPQAFAYEAALAMARQGFRHILVCDQGRLIGVVSEKDLFTLQRVGLRQISAAIRGAQSLEQLKQSARDIRQLAHNMLAQGVAAEQLTQFISTLNDLLTCRVIELECQSSGEPWCESFCWIALGSEGRLEQTLNTDQDNGIIFDVPEGGSADEIRARLLPLAKRINEALDACGFPLCKGEVMASNPKWCLSLEEWKETFAEWIHRGDRPVLLNATIFFDFRPLWGRQGLAQELRSWLNGRIRDERLFLRFMTENALGNRPPLGVVRDFVVGEAHTLDLKLNGITPFVDAARIFALAAGVEETSTIRRLRAAATTWRIDPAEAEAWVEAFLYIQMLRLRLQHGQEAQSAPLSNRVDPDALNPLDRRILKEAFRQARKLQSVLGSYFQF